MKKIFFLAVLLTSGSAFADVKLAHYWNFDEFSLFSKIETAPDTLPYDPDGIWTLNLKKVGQEGAYTPGMIMPSSDVTQNTHGYGKDYNQYAHVGDPHSGAGYAYLSCQGTLLNFNQSWAYSITSWIRPEVSSSMVLFSIGAAGEGFRLIYNPTSGYLSYSLSGIEANFGSIDIGKFSYQSDWSHIGFSMDNDGLGNLTVNYYLNGEKFHGGTASVQSLLDKTINGFNIGADGTDGGMTGSCNYDDIKIFTGVLDEAEIKEAMKPGTGNFVIDDPTIPEPSTALLACLGSLFLLRRRRSA